MAAGRVGAGRAVALAAALALGPAAATGFARFAYALLLPSMRRDLGWSYALAGTPNTANAVGYMLGAVGASRVASRVGSVRVFGASVAIAAATLFACAATGSLAVLCVLRLVAGLAGGASFVTGGGIATEVAARARGVRPYVVLSVYFAGVGVGIFVSALIVPPVIRGGDWRAGWIVLAVASLVAVAATLLAAPRLPDVRPAATARAAAGASLRPLRPTFVAYFLFGMGYIAYMTFVIALLRSHGFGTGGTTAFWAVLGASATLASPFWSRALAHTRRGTGLALLLVVMTVGATLPVVSSAAPSVYVSAVLFGSTFVSTATAVTNLARRLLPRSALTYAFGAFTFVFGAGQCLGPVISGLLSDTGDGLSVGLGASAAILLVAAAVSLAQRDAVRSTRPPAA